MLPVKINAPFASKTIIKNIIMPFGIPRLKEIAKSKKAATTSNIPSIFTNIL